MRSHRKREGKAAKNYSESGSESSLTYLMRYWDHVSCGDFLSLYRILSGKIITFSLAVMCARFTMMIDEKNLRRCYQVFPQYLPRRDILYRWQLLHFNMSMWVNEIFWRQQRLKIRWYLGRATNIRNDRISKKRNLIFITHGSLAMMRRLGIVSSEEWKSRHRLGKKKNKLENLFTNELWIFDEAETRNNIELVNFDSLWSIGTRKCETKSQLNISNELLDVLEDSLSSLMKHEISTFILCDVLIPNIVEIAFKYFFRDSSINCDVIETQTRIDKFKYFTYESIDEFPSFLNEKSISNQLMCLVDKVNHFHSI